MVGTADIIDSTVGARHAARESATGGRRFAPRRAAGAVDGVRVQAHKASEVGRVGVGRRKGLVKKARAGLVVGLLGASLGLAGLTVQPAHADGVSGVETVGVQVGWDQAVYSISSTVATTQTGAATPSISRYSMDPSDQSRLPVRVRISYQAGDQSGTDLSALKGYTGPVLIRLTVENVTVTPQELSFESQGAKYRGYGLVGAPYTVVASAALGAGTLNQIVTAGTTMPLTDGVVTESENQSAEILWTAILAPPVSLPSAVFTLSIDATNFQPPQFNVTVEPGLVTNPSLSGVMGGGQADNSQAVQLMLGAQQTVSEASDLVAQVQKALSQDANVLGGRTYAQLSASSAITLSELSSLSSQMRSMSSGVSSDLTAASSAFSTTLHSVFGEIETKVLGDPNSTTPVLMTPESIDGCTITLPSLDPSQPATVAATLQLLQAQADVLADAFGNQDSADAAANPNCRTALVDAIMKSVGSNTTDVATDCGAGGVQEGSLWCNIHHAQATLKAKVDIVNDKKHDVDKFADPTAGATLLADAGTLWTEIQSLTTGGGGTIAFTGGELTGMGGTLSDIQSVVNDETARLDQIGIIADGTNPVVAYVLGQVSSYQGCQDDVGELSGVDALTAMANDLDPAHCPLKDLAAAAAEDQANWDSVKALTDTSEPMPGTAVPDYATASTEVTASLATLSTDISTLTTSPSPTLTLSSIFTGKIVPAGSVSDACTATLAPPPAGPLGSGDVLFEAINKWACMNYNLVSAIADLKTATDKATNLATDDLDSFATQANTASTDAKTAINDMSDALSQFFVNQDTTTIAGMQATLGTYAGNMSSAETTTEDALTQQIDLVVGSLQKQVDGAALNADTTAASLQTNFKNLMIDLGDPQSASSAGLIGSLKTMSTTVKSVADQLTLLGVTIGGNVTSQQLAAQNAALQSAQLSSGQQMLDGTPYFCGQPKPDGSYSIYTFHIGEA
ncbi:MAG: hypothetical protein FWF36_08425 [Propionibacteriaceae bacterium]|nr:hypothetical protein [Propionibacteriaceae bacterium]